MQLSLEKFLGSEIPERLLEPNSFFDSYDKALVAAWEISATLKESIMVRKWTHYGTTVIAQVRAYPES